MISRVGYNMHESGTDINEYLFFLFYFSAGYPGEGHDSHKVLDGRNSDTSIRM